MKPTAAADSRPGDPLRVLVHDFAGYAFPVELSRELARRGHHVAHAYCPDIPTGKGRLQRSPGDPDNLEIVAVPIGREFDRYSPARRVRDELDYGKRVTRAAQAFEPQAVISANTPLLSQRALQRFAHRRRAAFAYWLQDLLGIGTANELARRSRLVGATVGPIPRRLERQLLLRSDEIIPIADDFVVPLLAMGVPPQRLEVIENWAPVAELPVRPKNNRWAKAHDLAERFCLLYCGTLGLKHDPDLLVGLAEHFRDDPRVVVVVVSEGTGADRLRERSLASGLDNLRTLDYQPYEQLPDVLGSADVLVAVLGSSAGVFSVPSKLLTYLCAERPVLAAIPSTNLATRIIAGSGGGVSRPPEDTDGFLAAASLLRANSEMRARYGRSGRAYAEARFRPGPLAERFEQVIRRALARPDRASRRHRPIA